MKKAISMLCVVLVIGFAGTAFAGRANKVPVCHNGSVYTGDTTDGAVYDLEEWGPGSFVINISGNGNAVDKHLDNHFGDTTDITLTGEMVTTEVHVIEGETVFEKQPECVPGN
jgi:hypothetical protein